MQRLPSDRDVELALMEGITDEVENEAAKLVTSRTPGSAHEMNFGIITMRPQDIHVACWLMQGAVA